MRTVKGLTKDGNILLKGTSWRTEDTDGVNHGREHLTEGNRVYNSGIIDADKTTPLRDSVGS